MLARYAAIRVDAHMKGGSLIAIRGIRAISPTICFIFTAFALTATASAQAWSPAPSLPQTGNTSENNNHLQKVAVFGADNRGALPRALRSLKKSIGLVYNNRARSVCTGFCVSDRIIATAAHCLFRTAGERRPKLAEFRFVLRAQKNWPSSRIEGFQSRSPDQFVIAGSHKLKVEPPIDATRDWALMRLARPLCRGAVLPVQRPTSMTPRRRMRPSLGFGVA